MSRCCSACDQGRRPCPTPEACHAPRPERMGSFKPWERFWMQRPGWVAIGSALCFALIVWATKP